MAESVTLLQVKSLQSKKKSGRLAFLVKITRRVGRSEVRRQRVSEFYTVSRLLLTFHSNR